MCDAEIALPDDFEEQLDQIEDFDLDNNKNSNNDLRYDSGPAKLEKTDLDEVNYPTIEDLIDQYRK